MYDFLGMDVFETEQKTSNIAGMLDLSRFTEYASNCCELMVPLLECQFGGSEEPFRLSELVRLESPTTGLCASQSALGCLKGCMRTVSTLIIVIAQTTTGQDGIGYSLVLYFRMKPSTMQALQGPESERSPSIKLLKVRVSISAGYFRCCVSFRTFLKVKTMVQTNINREFLCVFAQRPFDIFTGSQKAQSYSSSGQS